MSQVIELDPERIEQWEPSERDGPNTIWWISPYEVPRRIDLMCGSGFTEIRAIRFEYPSSEPGEDWTPLDDRTDPAVQVRFGRSTRKILELVFANPIPLGQLPAIAARLKPRSLDFQVKATKFNYQMIAAIFENWNEAVAPIDGTP